MTSPTYDPAGRPTGPSVEQPDPRLGAPVPPGSFADSELEYAPTEGEREPYREPVGSDMGSRSTVETARSEAANVKDTAAGAAAGVKDVAKGEATNIAEEAKYQARSLVDQTRTELRGQASSQQSALADKLHAWASELGSMASKADESGPMSDLAQEASRKVGEFSHWLGTHEPADLLEEVKRYARRRPVTFLAIAAAAGVVAGRLTRGAVATKTSVDSDRESTPARAYDTDLYDGGGYDGGVERGAYETRTYQGGSYEGGSYDPRYAAGAQPGYQGAGTAPTGTYQDTGVTTPGEYPASGTAAPEPPRATGTSYPNVTPTSDETYYPPPAEGEVRR